ncbi:MAG: hypothetical protein JNN11_01585 [Candidatus Doudnabacteria bacterium]|nr:hypothetical protein [Candidatus Doudnabacteria bacterium]
MTTAELEKLDVGRAAKELPDFKEWLKAMRTQAALALARTDEEAYRWMLSAAQNNWMFRPLRTQMVQERPGRNSDGICVKIRVDERTVVVVDTLYSFRYATLN